VLDDLYGNYLGNLKSSDRYCCPPASILHTLSAVWQTLDAPESVAVTAQDFNVVVEGFPAYIATYQADLKRKVVPPSMQGLALQEVERTLCLAKNVFRCQAAKNRYTGGDYCIPGTARDQTLLGWTAIASHSCGAAGKIDFRLGVTVNNPQCNMTLHEKSSPLSSTLVALAGLNPATATLSDMDTLDARFVIAEGSMPSWWTTDYMVFTWRGAVRLSDNGFSFFLTILRSII
jgi:hypothetical protein